MTFLLLQDKRSNDTQYPWIIVAWHRITKKGDNRFSIASSCFLGIFMLQALVCAFWEYFFVANLCFEFSTLGICSKSLVFTSNPWYLQQILRIYIKSLVFTSNPWYLLQILGICSSIPWICSESLVFAHQYHGFALESMVLMSKYQGLGANTKDLEQIPRISKDLL